MPRDLLQTIAGNPALSTHTKANYQQRAKQLAAIAGHDIRHVLKHPKQSLHDIARAYPELLSQRSMIACVLGMFKHNPGFKCRHMAEFNAWYSAYAEVSQRAFKRYDDNTPSDRQRQSYLPWADIAALRDAMDPTSQDYLVVCMYTMIPPARLDYNAVRVYTSEEQAAQDAARHPNQVILCDSSTKLVLREFKTSRCFGGGVAQEVPADLAAVIRSSLARSPRRYLIVSPRTGQPYLQADGSAYQKYVNGILKRLTGKPHMSVSLLRHSFVNAIDADATFGERKRLARLMGHTYQTQGLYRLRITSTAPTSYDAHVGSTPPPHSSSPHGSASQGSPPHGSASQGSALHGPQPGSSAS